MASVAKNRNSNTIIRSSQGRKPYSVYVTFLAGDGDYWKGVVALAKGLRCIIREIEPLYPPENQTPVVWRINVIIYSKRLLWEFVEYSKMIYLDGDIQVFDNIDHLFDMPDGYFYAVMDCQVVHYVPDVSKPWRYTGKEVNMDREDIKMLVKKWWDIYNDESLDYWRIRGDSMPIMMLDKPAHVVSKKGSRYVTAPSAA
ncbi:galactinol synthase 2 [Tanacetum coccineum]